MVRTQVNARYNAPVFNFGAKTVVQKLLGCLLDHILQLPFNLVERIENNR